MPAPYHLRRARPTATIRPILVHTARDVSVWPSTLRPRPGARPYEREPFAVWWARVRSEIPDVPEGVAEQWVHRHFDGSPYAFLPIEQLRFEQQSWSLEQLAAVTFGACWSWNPTDVARLDRERATPLATMMLETGTWPAPILVLDNPDGLLDDTGVRMGRWHLVEGHRRLTYLRCLASRGAARPTHPVWIVSLAPA